MSDFQGMSNMSVDERNTLKLGFNQTMEEVIESLKLFQKQMNNVIDFQNPETPHRYRPDIPWSEVADAMMYELKYFLKNHELFISRLNAVKCELGSKPRLDLDEVNNLVFGLVHRKKKDRRTVGSRARKEPAEITLARALISYPRPPRQT